MTLTLAAACGQPARAPTEPTTTTSSTVTRLAPSTIDRDVERTATARSRRSRLAVDARRTRWYQHTTWTAYHLDHVELWADWPAWSAIARCETGTRWDWHTTSYGGALGIAHVTWQAFGGTEYAPTAGDATPWQQLLIARKIRDRYHGYHPWGCGRNLGL